MNFINLTLSLNAQHDSSYFLEETERPSRAMYTGNIVYHYLNNVTISGRIVNENSKVPDYKYTTSSINLEIAF